MSLSRMSPRPRLLLPSGAFDRRAILRAAHAEARAILAEQARFGGKPWRYALALKHALHSAWGDARTYRWIAQEDARLAAMRPEVADLIRERAIALHIDSYPAMTRELAAISARAAALGVTL